MTGAAGNSLVACATVDGRVEVCDEVAITLAAATCATCTGDRAEARQHRREAATMMKLHLRLAELEREGQG